MKRLKTHLIVWIGSILFSHALSADQFVRIAVGEYTESLTIAAASLSVLSEEGKSIYRGKSATVHASETGIYLNGKKLDTKLLRIKSDGRLKLKNREFHNHLEIWWRSETPSPHLLVVHPVSLERYVAGTVSSEVPSRWPHEALKAQAIAARTYAIYQKYKRLNDPYHLSSTVLDQVYHGAKAEYASALKATKATLGQVLTYGHEPIQAFFHSTCGDQTESAEEGFQSSLPYLPGSRCGYCKAANRYNWTYRISMRDLNRKLQHFLGEPIKTLKIRSTTDSGRVKSVDLVGRKHKKTLRGTELRKQLGYHLLPSTLITSIQKRRKEMVFRGKGHGHGVGMCQWGVKGMAAKGHLAKEILAKYYPKAEIRKMY